jgi:WbqC-like protein family
MKVAISQPAYLPWIGYFDLIDQVDQFVVLDNVQFEKQSWQQRNRIKTAAGLQWLTVPVEFRGRLGQQIREVRIRQADFSREHLRAVELAYRRAPFFEDYYDMLRSHLSAVRTGSSLMELNLGLLRWFLGMLGITTPLVIASELPVAGKRTQLLAAICHHLGAANYVSPLGSAAYLLNEMSIMSQAGVEVLFQHYEHPEYHQLFPPFVPYGCMLDLIFNEGPRSLEIVRSGRREPFRPEQAAAQLAERPVHAR